MVDAGIMAECARDLRRARRVGVLTGAGISAESGIPTFRGPGGYWRGLDPMRLATPTAFAADPALVWEWYSWRRRQVAAAEPNPGHRALVELERRVPDFLLATQNVDGLHRRAGSTRLVELHGDLFETRCQAPCGHARRDPGPPPELGPDAGRSDPGEGLGAPSGSLAPPACPRCGDRLRPGVVWFGEALPAGAFDAAARHAGQTEVYLVVGTSGAVEPAASLAEIARSGGARVFEVNPSPGPGRRAKILAGPAGSVLPELLRTAWPEAEILS